MNKNKYDEGYDVGINHKISHHYNYWDSTHQIPYNKLDVFEQGKRDGREGKPRHMAKSLLITDGDYLTFLHKIGSPKDEYILCEWVSGGRAGGNCWGGVEDRPIDPEESAELTELDSILEKVSPSITFLQYKSLVKDLIKSGTYTIDEYYGNHTIYSYKYILLYELYEALTSRGLI